MLGRGQMVFGAPCDLNRVGAGEEARLSGVAVTSIVGPSVVTSVLMTNCGMLALLW